MKHKFRGVICSNKKTWIYGSLIENNGHPIIIRAVGDFSVANNGDHWSITKPAYRVKSESVGLCSGLHDKNDKDIYEGDIVLDHWGNECAVEYNDGCFWVCQMDREDVTPLYVHCDTLTPILCEVVGNLHTGKYVKTVKEG